MWSLSYRTLHSCAEGLVLACFFVTRSDTLIDQDTQTAAKRYGRLPNTAPELLSSIFIQLGSHIGNQSSKSTIAMFAFLLSAVSMDYFGDVCSSVGYTTRSLLSTPSIQLPPRLKKSILDLGEEATQEGNINIQTSEGFPSFFSEDLCQTLLRARESLRLLRSAEPDHSLLIQARSQREIRWFWTAEDVERAWLSESSSHSSSLANSRSSKATEQISVAHASPVDEPALQAFKLFDLEPGVHLGTLGKALESSADTGFSTFLSTFPDTLPSLTPSLEDLTELVLSPLVRHINSLSAALVNVFLASDGYLTLHTHLELLRSHVLLTSQAFKSRLTAALFCDAPEPPEYDVSAHAIAARASHSRSLSRGSTGRDASIHPSDSWVIGLSPSLTEGLWPPAGADLGYYLRTVIIDSLDIDHPERELSEHGPHMSDGQAQIFEEAEWRLGFALRDLPTGSGQAKWLDPKSME